MCNKKEKKLKNYTDGNLVVRANHRAGAFDELQKIYGHPNIGNIYTVTELICFDSGEVASFRFDYNENPWKEENTK